MRSPRRVLFLAALLLAIATPSIHAQSAAQLRVGLSPPVEREGATPLLDLSSAKRGTYWKEGGIAGGVVTAMIGFAFLMDKDESGRRAAPLYAVPPLTVLSALVGFGPGALLGSLVTKPTSDERTMESSQRGSDSAP